MKRWKLEQSTGEPPVPSPLLQAADLAGVDSLQQLVRQLAEVSTVGRCFGVLKTKEAHGPRTRAVQGRHANDTAAKPESPADPRTALAPFALTGIQQVRSCICAIWYHCCRYRRVGAHVRVSLFWRCRRTGWACNCLRN